eukprot:scaffold23394_cov39-Phaeocystis_antarctica.AAC.2
MGEQAAAARRATQHGGRSLLCRAAAPRDARLDRSGALRALVGRQARRGRALLPADVLRGGTAPDARAGRVQAVAARLLPAPPRLVAAVGAAAP